MRLSNLRNYRQKKSGFKTLEFATVDATTGIIFKKTVTKDIACEFATWFFVDTGQFTPGYQAEKLVRAYRAKEHM